jgi:hypothetical protein
LPQVSVNAMTDVVVLGSIYRERRWDSSVKGTSLRGQLQAAAGGTRDKPLRAIRLADLVASLNVAGAVLARATCSDFGDPPGGNGGGSSSAAAPSSSSAAHRVGSRWLPRGPARDRGALLPRLLVTDDGAGGGAIAKGLVAACIPDPAAYWPAEDPPELAAASEAAGAGNGASAASSSAAAGAAETASASTAASSPEPSDS